MLFNKSFNSSKLLLLFFLVHASFLCLAQKKKFSIHTIAFYNLENLFDTINDPNKFDEYSPIMELKSGRQEAYRSKIKQMASVISKIGTDVTHSAPTLIGLCEIENRSVLEDLVNDSLLIKYDYGIIHYNSPDPRGIDVALLYKKGDFIPLKSEAYELKIYEEESSNRIYSRDQLLVSGKLDGDFIHLIINHWPSRRGGESKSEYKRTAAAKLTKRIIDSLQTVDPYSKILILGDFNDNPTNKSLKTELKTYSNRFKTPLKGIYNPYYNLFKNGSGTTAYRDSWSLFDQIILTSPLLEKDYSQYCLYKAGIFNKSYLINQNGPYKGYPLRSWTNEGLSNGYSDHFPVFVYLIKEVK